MLMSRPAGLDSPGTLYCVIVRGIEKRRIPHPVAQKLPNDKHSLLSLTKPKLLAPLR